MQLSSYCHGDEGVTQLAFGMTKQSDKQKVTDRFNSFEHLDRISFNTPVSLTKRSEYFTGLRLRFSTADVGKHVTERCSRQHINDLMQLKCGFMCVLHNSIFIFYFNCNVILILL